MTIKEILKPHILGEELLHNLESELTALVKTECRKAELRTMINEIWETGLSRNLEAYYIKYEKWKQELKELEEGK